MAKYSTLHYGSHPDSGNDDCFQGWDHETLEAALAAYNAPIHDSSVAYIEIDGLTDEELTTMGLERYRKNPTHSFPKRSDDGEWQREQAMQAGMAFGCDGYNEVMGYD